MSEIREEKTVLSVDPASADNYTCGLCYELLDIPIETPCCRHTYCFLCIEIMLRSIPECPSCRKKITSNDLLKPSVNSIKQLELIQVYCANKSDCTWVGNKTDLKSHLAKDCGSQIWTCPNNTICDLSACQERFYGKHSMQSHLEKCPFAKLKQFFTTLVGTIVQQKEESVMIKYALNLCNLRVANSETSINNIQRLIAQVPKIRSSQPLPSNPPISGHQYVRIDFSGMEIETSAVVPGCTYTAPEKRIIAADGIKDLMVVVNILANLGYMIADGTDIAGGTYWMEYAGYKWNFEDTQNGVNLPPYVYVRQADVPSGRLQLAPTIHGYSRLGKEPYVVRKYKLVADLVNSLAAEHSYRLIIGSQTEPLDEGIQTDEAVQTNAGGTDRFLLQKCSLN